MGVILKPHWKYGRKLFFKHVFYIVYERKRGYDYESASLNKIRNRSVCKMGEVTNLIIKTIESEF